jgi:DNA-binding NarL/FixJ family response regulator
LPAVGPAHIISPEGRYRPPMEAMMQVSENVRVLVMHQDPVMAEGLVAVLARQAGLTVSTGLEPDWPIRDAPRDPSELYDVVVSDYESGLSCLAQFKAAGKPRCAFATRVLVLTARARESEVRKAMTAGVHGYVLQGCPLDELVRGVRSVGRGARYFCETVAQRVIESLTRVTLTTRETEVLELLQRGYCNKTIARDLGIAPGTVKAHVKGILEKLDATTRTQAVAVATERGLVSATPATLASAAPQFATGALSPQAQLGFSRQAEFA